MRQTRRQIEKIRVPVRRTFDQEFWPVLVALGVLLGIAGGAILTLMRGPWMWGSLLILPALAALAIYSLYRLDESRLRRSFQLAIMISFAVHLLILMFASMTSIFNNSYQRELTKIAPKENKSIVISQRQNKFVWQQSNKHATPEPEVETRRKQSQTNAQPQTVPVESRQLSVNPQVVRRESTRPTVPRLDQQSSQLRRQMTNTRPKSTAPAAAASETSKLADNPKTPKRVQPSNSASPTKQQSSASTASKSTVETRPEPTRKITQTVARRETATASPAPAQESQSMARIERQTPKMPKLATVAAPNQSSRPSTTSSRSAEATESSLARQNTTKATSKSAANPKPAETRAVVASSRRQESPITQPTLSKPDMTSPIPRTTTTQSPVSATAANVASPSRPISAKTSQPRQPAPQSLAVARATGGTAGAGRSRNLDRGTGGVASPARTASDSSSDRRQENRVAKNISLSSQQRSELGRATASALKPSSSLTADMSDMAKLAGSKSPSLVSESSSASNIDAATAQTSANSVAEKGQSQMDLGPTKIVNGPVSNRRSGGGMPEIAESSTPSNRPAGRTSSDKAPTQIAAAGVRTQGPLNPSSMPVEGQANQFQQADEIARANVGQSSDQNAITPAATTMDGPTSTSIATQIAQRPSRNQSDWSRDPALMDEDAAQRQSPIQGNAKTMLSQAPQMSRSVDFGFENPIRGQGRELDAVEGESLAAEVLRRAADSVAGSVLSRSAGTAVVQAATSMPLVDTSGNGNGNRNRKRSANVLATAGLSESEITPNTRMQSNTPLPKLAGNPVPGGAESSPAGSVKVPRIQSTGSDAAEEISRNGSDMPGSKLDIDAVEGPAGLAATHHVRLGIQTRPASIESDNIAAESITRFRRKDFGGVPAMNPDAVLAREAFRQRQPAVSAGAPPSTEVAIQSGLEFLARYQLPDGSWTLGQFDVDHQLHQSQLNSDTAATGLALIAFQGAGYNHREFKYARQLQLAIDWMLANQSRDGGLYLDADDKSDGAARMYSHAIATLALTEAYGMTQDSKLREPAQRAINYISGTQDPERGGWRYFAEKQKRSSDTSVTGWMMMALVSGQLSGLDVNPGTLSGIDNWLTLSRAGDAEFEFRYNPFAIDTGGVSRLYSRKASQSMTAVGLLMQVYSGWDREDPRFRRGAERLLQQLPSDANAKLRDTYYWYYATQVLKHAGGQAWEDWNARLQPLLVRSQEKDGDYRGSWDPYEPVPDRWGPHGGRLYVTAMNLLSLEVRYRLLPLYDKTIK